jgi:hypothetical protein
VAGVFVLNPHESRTDWRRLAGIREAWRIRPNPPQNPQKIQKKITLAPVGGVLTKKARRDTIETVGTHKTNAREKPPTPANNKESRRKRKKRGRIPPQYNKVSRKGERESQNEIISNDEPQRERLGKSNRRKF